MNISVLQKLERSYIQLDWKSYINRVELSIKHMETIIDMIDVFKDNKGAEEIVIFRFEGIPAYITIKRKEFSELLDWMYNRMLLEELYANCKRIKDIIKLL